NDHFWQVACPIDGVIFHLYIQNTGLCAPLGRPFGEGAGAPVLRCRRSLASSRAEWINDARL
ncbi:MAG TPA: hypothetical protein VIV12_05515, partial [Streptosporangiaceae bacterium]